MYDQDEDDILLVLHSILLRVTIACMFVNICNKHDPYIVYL